MKTLELKDIATYLPYGLKYLYEGKTIGEVRMQDYVTTIDSMLRLNFIIQPILRPMSDLTKEITHKGEKFVPLVEFGRMIEPDGHWELHENRVYDLNYKGSVCLSYIYNLFEFKLDYEVEVIDMLVIYDKLAEWMFDYRGLIPAKLAIDANTLLENPYEK